MTTATIREAATPADVALARSLFEEYARWLAVDLCFQNFAEELATLPGAYAPPAGRLLLAGAPGTAFACVALRPLAAGVGEVKRLYVQPAHRGEGWGRRLVEALLAHARAIGYAELKLDTLAQMDDARKLYAAMGFEPCAPYYRNPLDGTLYLRKRLDTVAAGGAARRQP